MIPRNRSEWIASVIGGLIGLALVGYFFVYAPMRHNYEQCGKVTLCDPQR